MGVRSFTKKVDKIEIERMANTLRHRGPDGIGTWLNKDKNLGLGHSRLSIIDLSQEGNQPMHCFDNRYTITFNGEIYNYLELRKELEKDGYKFKSKTDTEVLLALYRKKKEACLDYLDGMFAFAIWDDFEKKLFCARDRFGEKPFYYSINRDRFIFGSEMKALWKAGVPKNPIRKQIFNYLAFDDIQSRESKKNTFYEGIFQLEPSSYLILNSNGDIFEKKYWDINPNEKQHYTIDEASGIFYDKLEKSISRRLRSDVPIGSSLSGGIDSSTIVTIIDKLKSKSQKQKTFSARFDGFEKDEGKWMHSVINSCKNVEPFFTWLTAKNLTQNLEQVFYHQEEPFGSASIVVQWEVMKLAKENNITVLLDGQGADELLAGYMQTYGYYLWLLYRKGSGKYNQEKEYYENNQSTAFNDSFQLKIRNRLPKFYRILDRYKYNSFLNKKYFPDLNQEFINENKIENPPTNQKGDLKSHLKSLLLDTNLSELLRYADRNSMAHGREVRLPFLSHELVEFVFTLPDHFFINQGWTKFILRRAMNGKLVKNVCWRSDKIGYEPPQKEWLNDSMVKDLLSQSVKALGKEKIISPQNITRDNSWKYLMLGMCFKND